MKKSLFIIFVLLSFYSQAQWTGASIDSLTQNAVTDEVNRNCMDIDRNSIHVVFKRVNPVAGYDLFYMNRDSSGTWSTETQISTLPANNPCIAKWTSPNAVSVAYQATDSVDGDEEIFLAYKTAGTWYSQQLTHDTTEDVYPTIVNDALRYSHVTWVGVDSMGTYKIMYATNKTGQFIIQTLALSDPGPFGAGASPEIAVEPSGIAHIAFRAGNFGTYRIDHIYNSSAGGTAWIVENLTTPNPEDLLADIEITNDSIVHIVASGNGGFGFPWSSYYMVKSGASGTFSTPQQIAASFSGPLGDMFIDQLNIPHFVLNEVSGNIYTGNIIYADSNNWAGTLLLQTTDLFEANMVMDEQNNAYLLSYQGTSLPQEEVIIYGPSGNVDVEYMSVLLHIHDFDVTGDHSGIEIHFHKDYAARLEIYDVQGKLILAQTMNKLRDEIFSVKNLAEGVYVVKGKDRTVRVVVGY